MRIGCLHFFLQARLFLGELCKKRGCLDNRCQDMSEKGLAHRLALAHIASGLDGAFGFRSPIFGLVFFTLTCSLGLCHPISGPRPRASTPKR